MREYQVRIKEILSMTVAVEAESMVDAKKVVERNWNDSEYILDASHFQGVSFETLYPPSRDYER